MLLFGPAKDRCGTWRIETSVELKKLIRNKNAISYIKDQIVSWFGHEHRLTNDRTVKCYTSANRYL